MSDLERMEMALENAAKAGDVAAAQHIAREMRLLLQAENPSLGKPQDPRVEGARMAAEGMDTGETLTVGAGRTADKLISGLQQLRATADTRPGVAALRPPGLVEADKRQLRELEAEQKEKDIAYSALKRQSPFTTSIGESLPYLGVPASAGVVPAAGAIGGIEALQYGTPGERATRGVMGAGSALVGGAVGKAVGGLVGPIADDAISGTRAAALAAGSKLGIRPRLSETTGSQFLSRMEDMAARTPGGAGIMSDFARANQQNVNRAAARTIGETASELSPSVFASASDRLGKVFEEIKNLPGRPIQFTKAVGDVADDIIRQQGKMIAQQQDENLTKLAMQAKTLSQNKGRIDGEAYQLLRSGLSEASFDASGTNRNLYGKLLEAIDNSADFSLRSAGKKELADALKTSRPQYSNLKTLERGLVAEGGDVSPARVAQVLRQKNPAAFREGRGQGELYDIARYGETFKPLRAGSPTYEREAASDLLGLLLKSPLAYGVAKVTTSPMLGAYPAMLARNPQAALFANQVGGLLAPTVRGGTMGLLGPVLPVMAE